MLQQNSWINCWPRCDWAIFHLQRIVNHQIIRQSAFSRSFDCWATSCFWQPVFFDFLQTLASPLWDTYDLWWECVSTRSDEDPLMARQRTCTGLQTAISLHCERAALLYICKKNNNSPNLFKVVLVLWVFSLSVSGKVKLGVCLWQTFTSGEGFPIVHYRALRFRTNIDGFSILPAYQLHGLWVCLDMLFWFEMNNSISKLFEHVAAKSVWTGEFQCLKNWITTLTECVGLQA